MADSDTPITEGRIIIPSKMEAVKIPLPFVPVKSCMIGTITTKPKKPYTMEGIPASRETAGFTILYNLSGQNLARKIAHRIPIGTPMITAPAVT